MERGRWKKVGSEGVKGLFNCLTQCNENLHKAEMEGMELQNGCAELNSENTFIVKIACIQQKLATCVK